MTFRPAIWYPIAVVLTAINLVGLGFAVAEAEGSHAAAHAALVVVFGLWAQRLRQSRGGSQVHARLDALENSDGQDRLEALEDEVSKLRQELSEAQERLDFFERLLAQRPEAGRVGPQR